jgi:WD40 repeat protein
VAVTPLVAAVATPQAAGSNAMAIAEVLTASHDGTARLWCRKTGQCLWSFEDPEAENRDAQATSSADGMWVLTATYNGTASVWSVLTGAKCWTYKGEEGKLYAVSFSPDGQAILTAGAQGMACWGRHSGVQAWKIDGKTRSASFSPDGKRIVTIGGGRLVRLWSWQEAVTPQVAVIPQVAVTPQVVEAAVTPQAAATPQAAVTPVPPRLFKTLSDDLGDATSAIFLLDGSLILTAHRRTAAIWCVPYYYYYYYY